MKYLLDKLIKDKQQTLYRIVWHNGMKPEPILAVCKTKKECKQIIKDRKDIWFQCRGYDITSQLEIVSFKVEEE